MLDNIKKFILNSCDSDVKAHSKIKNSIIDYYNQKNQWSYMVELMIITIKSLLPLKDEVGVEIDYNRFKQELELWMNYRHGENECLLHSIKNIDAKVYWNCSDKSIYSRIVPIVFVNKYFDKIRTEVIKNILFTTGNIDDLLEGLLLSKLLFLIINSNKDYDNILNELKKEIINLSQKQLFDESQKSYRLPIDMFIPKYKINFEKRRIELINTLHGKANQFETLVNSLNMIKNHNKNNILDTTDFFVRGVEGILNNKVIYSDIKDKNFIENLCLYLDKLRHGRISPESLYIKNYYLPDIFDFNNGEEFNHSLLNKCKVIKRDRKGDYTISYISTKTGIYRFFKHE